MVNYLAACIQQRESDTLELYNHLRYFMSQNFSVRLLPPADVVRREGNVFTGVCLSTGVTPGLWSQGEG